MHKSAYCRGLVYGHGAYSLIAHSIQTFRVDEAEIARVNHRRRLMFSDQPVELMVCAREERGEETYQL